MSNLLFIKNLEELDYIEKNLKNFLDSYKIVTICSLPWLRLHGQGFCVEQVSDYVSVEEFEGVLEEARLLSQEWYKPFEHLLNYRGINLGEIVRIEQIWFFRELISSYLAFKRIIEINRPDEVVIFADLEIPSLDIFRYDGSNDIFSAVALWMCEDKAIAVHKLSLRHEFKILKRSFWRRLKRKVTRYLPVILFFYNYLSAFIKTISYRRDWHYFSWGSISGTPQKKLATAAGSSFELFILSLVMKALSDSRDFDIVFINFETNFNRALERNRSGLDGDVDLQFVTLDDFGTSILPKKREIISSLQKARRYFESHSFQDDFLYSKYSQLLKNPYLSVQFDFIWGNYFYSAVSLIDKFNEVFRKCKPEVVIIANSMGYRQRIFAQLASRYGVKSITVPHGWVGDIDEYEFESDLFLAWGELSQKQLMVEFNKTEDNIAVVGAIQFEGFATRPKHSSGAEVKDIKEKFGFRLDARVVIIITGGLPQSVFSQFDMKRFFKSWELIKLFISEHPEIDFVIKPHPGDEATPWYRQLVIDFNRSNLKIIKEVKLESLLPAIDIGILMGYPSTAGYLCILFKVPIIIFKSFIRTGLFSTIEAWSEDNGVLVVNQESDLGGIIKQLLDDSAFREETIKREEGFLDRSILVRDGKVKERIIEAVKKICK